MMTMMKGFQKLWLVGLILAMGLITSRARALDLWPLAEFTNERTTVLYPFYVHEGNFMMIFPLYYRTNEGRDRHFLWPMIKFSEGRLTRAMPLWFSADRDTFTIFPFLRQTPDYTFWVLPPVYTRHDGRFTAVYPLFAHSPEMLFAAPDFYRWQKGGKNQLNINSVLFQFVVAGTGRL